MTKKILLHVCCGPCATYVVKRLVEEEFRPTGLYFNPNIHPQQEYLKRRNTAGDFFKMLGLEFSEGEYDADKYYACIGDNKTLGIRCRGCYWLRLEKTVQMAVKLNFPYFSTTLLISPFQNQEALREIGRGFAKKYKINFYEEDFVKGYKESRRMAKELGMYRQKYCGCEYSIK